MTCTEECRKPINRQAHCSVCHKTFTGITWFDLHRVGGQCHDIEGVVGVNGLWTTVEAHENRARLAEKLKGYKSLRKQHDEML